MSKIFRLHTGGASTYMDWNSSPAFPYHSTNRDTIADPEGASASHEITSIPSPFARIDLVKTAFKEVCKPDPMTNKVNLAGNTIFHKMVSDTLDVAEIFFNIDKFKDQVEIIGWDSSLMLDELKSSGIPGHYDLADALQKYLASDARTYNFGPDQQTFYLLNYIAGPNKLNIIGATSPATLFFSNANDLSYIDDIFFGQDKPFDADYQPLYKRDPEFIKYLFTLQVGIPNFAGLFPEVDQYLTESFRAIADPSLKQELRNLSVADLQQFSPISFGLQQNNRVEVLGFQLHKKSPKPITDSDFMIKSSLATHPLPLVLPVESGNHYSSLRYTTGTWGRDNAAPYVEEEPDLAKRILPFDGTPHPYLTISDLLEDWIIRVPYTLNDKHYFSGIRENDKRGKSYLLPIKPLFFRYFTPEELRGNVGNQPMLEMEVLSGGTGIKVMLRIPIQGSAEVPYIEYARRYYQMCSAGIANNEGEIIDPTLTGSASFQFTGFIMPQIKFTDPVDAIYNVSCIQDISASNEFVFYRDGNKILPKSRTCRNEGEHRTKADNYLIEGENFDFIQVRNNRGQSGILLPIFNPQKNSEKFEFAIDLGTSNTHIEYRNANDRQSQVFSFAREDSLKCEIFVPDRNEEGEIEDGNLVEKVELIEKDFIPDEIGINDFRFPTRTVLSYAKSIDWINRIDPFMMVNLPFTYDKRYDLPYNKFENNLKWGKGNELRMMEAYIRCLMLIIRNKVLLSNGSLKDTRITWFYPISMARKRLSNLKITWEKAYKQYFDPAGTTHCMTESEAPISYFFQSRATVTDLINIDIGGGTTDVAFSKNKAIQYVTSFRFASNALFEDSFAEQNLSNGIIDWYKDEICNRVSDKNDIKAIFKARENPANMASFLFGLKDTRLKDTDASAVDFNAILREDEDFKIVFIIFFTAIIYHIAQIVKVLGLDLPRHIAFSGNGSKVIGIITSDSTLLARYTKLVFEKVLGRPYDKELDLIGMDGETNPKESTCKGGLIGQSNNTSPEIIVFKSSGTGAVTRSDTYATITPEYKGRIIEAVEKFFDFVLNDMNAEFNFDNNFGVTTSALQIARDTACKDLATYLEKGIDQYCAEIDSDTMIEETFFFYPIKGALQAISTAIYDSLSINKKDN